LAPIFYSIGNKDVTFIKYSRHGGCTTHYYTTRETMDMVKIWVVSVGVIILDQKRFNTEYGDLILVCSGPAKIMRVLANLLTN
jgi:hypothetical protein